MNLSTISPALRDAEIESNVGTIEAPVYIPAESGRVRTGRPASQSVQSRLKADGIEKDLDAQFPLGGRAQRRATARIEARQQRTGQRTYTNRQLLKERVVGDLVQQFNILDGHVPARETTRRRVANTLWQKAQLLVEQSEAAGQDMTIDEAQLKLRAVAAGKLAL